MATSRLDGKTCETSDGKPCKHCNRYVRGMSDYSIRCTNPDIPKRGGGYPMLTTARYQRAVLRSQQCLRSGFVPVAED